MTNQEINEYLAEHLFGLEKTIKTSAGWLFRVELNCGGITTPNYIENWQSVVEKLEAKHGHDIVFHLATDVSNHKNKMCKIELNKLHDNEQFFKEIGKTIGEAVCRAAVEYLKSLKGEKKDELHKL